MNVCLQSDEHEISLKERRRHKKSSKARQIRSFRLMLVHLSYYATEFRGREKKKKKIRPWTGTLSFILETEKKPIKSQDLKQKAMTMVETGWNFFGSFFFLLSSQTQQIPKRLLMRYFFHASECLSLSHSSPKCLFLLIVLCKYIYAKYPHFCACER